MCVTFFESAIDILKLISLILNACRYFPIKWLPLVSNCACLNCVIPNDEVCAYYSLYIFQLLVFCVPVVQRPICHLVVPSSKLDLPFPFSNPSP